MRMMMVMMMMVMMMHMVSGESGYIGTMEWRMLLELDPVTGRYVISAQGTPGQCMVMAMRSTIILQIVATGMLFKFTQIQATGMAIGLVGVPPANRGMVRISC